MDDTSKLEFLRGTLDVLILKALMWGPLHGYAITSLIRRQSDDALVVEEGTLYPALPFAGLAPERRFLSAHRNSHPQRLAR